jgi:hypothetical protein
MDKAKLKDNLLKATNLFNLYRSKEYQQTLLPILKELSQVQAEDPAKYPTREEFTRAVEIIFAKASAYNDLVDILERQEQVMNKLREQLDKPEKNFATGT